MKNHVRLITLLLAIYVMVVGTGCEKKSDRQPSDKKESSAVMGESKAQTVCPVMGGKINKQFFTDYQGKRVYFCCGGCDETFTKEPDKYLAKLKDQGVVLENAPPETEQK